ncbi:hypothetical protein SLEP1_g6727 [Rubroshorea leprosula]|uniref:Integrase catalytic domain-containing protein n=1 Tax=Rubroshorea leprosula TaxID=152421 RepID=A0AAV5I6Z3_9ROSI|nr:hypothetical protein SLEP1_g6727 [Rubroshorea leprosula]
MRILWRMLSTTSYSCPKTNMEGALQSLVIEVDSIEDKVQFEVEEEVVEVDLAALGIIREPMKEVTTRVQFSALFVRESVPDVWYVDSGCSNHMTGNINLFMNLDKSVGKKITMGDGTIQEAQGKGTVKLDEYGKNCIDDVLFVPHLDSNLLSVGQFMMDGYSLVFENMACYVYKDGTKKELLIKVPMAKNKCFPLTLDLHGLPIIEQVDGVYESCVYGKQHRDAFPKGKARRALKPAELIHANVCGPMNTLSLNKSRYFIIFVDDFSRLTWVYFAKEKLDAFPIFKKFKALVEKQSGCSIKVLRIDQGGEFVSVEFNRFCEDFDIKRQLTASYTPQQNGVAERKNRSLVEMAKSMLKAKGLPNSFWAKAIHTTAYIQNHSLTAALHYQTPFEAWHGWKPKVTHFKVFSDETKGYRFYDPITKKLLISRDVIFDEKNSWNWNEKKSPGSVVVNGILEDDPVMTEGEMGEGQISSTPNSGSRSCPCSPETPPRTRKARRVKSLVELYEQTQRCQMAHALERNQTWELVDFPKDNKVVSLKWVYKTKYNSDGSIHKHKARLIARGYMQQEGVDFDETLYWLPAFLNGFLEEDVYVQQPQGYEIEGQEQKVYKLKKALYGLKQAPQAWYERINAHFCSHGFHKSPSEPTLYVRTKGGDENDEGIFISQEKYAKDLLKKYRLEDCNSMSTPLVSNQKFSLNDGEKKVDVHAYCSLIGSLLYLPNNRPDIAFATSVLSRFM